MHHFDIPQKHNLIEVSAQAIVDVLPARDFSQEAASCDWHDLDEQGRGNRLLGDAAAQPLRGADGAAARNSPTS